VTDNDGNVEALKSKYADYLDMNKKPYVKICFDQNIDSGTLKVNGKPFNYNTLEPKFVKVNGVEQINAILGTAKTEDELHLFMKANKTDCALKIFDTKQRLIFPNYILDAITE
jgi:putative ATP-dependent endonuclease of OLD family